MKVGSFLRVLRFSPPIELTGHKIAEILLKVALNTLIHFLHKYITLIDTEEGHLLIENFVNIFFVTSLSVSLHNLLDFYNLFCLCCIVMSRRSVTH